MAYDRKTLLLGGVGIERLRARVEELGAGAERIMARAASTLARRLPVRASELIADKILNVPRTKVRGYLSASVSGDNVVLKGVEKRLPLQDFIGTRYGGPSTAGAVVQKYRDAPPEVYSAARAAGSNKLDGGAFAIKGRGVRAGIYQRLRREYHPGTNRQILTRRLGPSFSRAVLERRHGDIFPELIEAGREVLRAELERLLKV
jgi:hypothetical protein